MSDHEPLLAPGRLGVTVVEAARLLHCSRTTVYSEIAAGRLKCYMLGRHRRVTVASIRALVSDIAAP